MTPRRRRPATATTTPVGLTLGTGALIALGRDVRCDAVLVSRSRTQVPPLDTATAKAAGTLCGRTGTRDVVDASVALCAMSHGDQVLTSDPGDLVRLAPDVRIIDVSTLRA